MDIPKPHTYYEEKRSELVFPNQTRIPVSEQCNGCNTKGQCSFYTYFIYEYNNGRTKTNLESLISRCPCTICLIKGICQKPCDEYRFVKFKDDKDTKKMKAKPCYESIK